MSKSTKKAADQAEREKVHAAGRAATENPSATERGHSAPGITQKKEQEGVDLSTPSQPG